MNKKIILFSRDPGGANTVAPLYKKLILKGYDVKLYGKDVALSKYDEYELKGIDIATAINEISLDEMEKFLVKEAPDFIITGTSADDFTEKYLWKASEKLGIKSFAILDQWVNYGIRFSRFSVNELKDYERDREHLYVPYKILVMDEYAKGQMVKEGIKENKILVSGQPYFDYLIDRNKKITNKLINKFKRSIGWDDDDFIITYVSEPISRTYSENDGSEHYWGYSERTVFCEFIKALNDVTKRFNKKVKLIIRLHPKENEDNYDELINLVNTKFITPLIDRELDGFILMNLSDLICGMSSMFLIESAILKRTILSIQIGLKRENPFILGRQGVVKSILTSTELKAEIEKIILGDVIEVSNFSIGKGSIENVINFMEEILCQC
ncbi:hypothetical protein CDLVIII_5009 [Clostridium sp. DL-VIII]|uniref:hypothetical protein n=1 Tax=Clostridium sp. DL-VIII TaxID=641107 RepID=UPI00023B0635|nr:hypothetical protein [Clostridium sp. DL-VIII]EHJ01500.1 hypothetical protein CDLVIII_5009 [Clostridium sp. DL-VIII]